MNKSYTVVRTFPVAVIAIDADGNINESIERALEITLQSTNPAYPNDRNMSRSRWRDLHRVLRKLDPDCRDGDESTIGNRHELQQRVARFARDGYVGVYWCGVDCDGAQWSRSYAHPANMLRALEREIEQDTEWLDGPASYSFDRATEGDIQYAIAYREDRRASSNK